MFIIIPSRKFSLFHYSTPQKRASFFCFNSNFRHSSIPTPYQGIISLFQLENFPYSYYSILLQPRIKFKYQFYHRYYCHCEYLKPPNPVHS